MVTADSEILIIESVLSEDTESDLIRVGLDFPPGKSSFIKGTPSLPAPGSAVTVAGGKTSATVSAVKMVPVYGFLMRIEGTVPLSGAGSPVFNEDGKLVGIVMFKLYGKDNVAWAIPARKTASVMASGSQSITHLEWIETQVGSWYETNTGSYLIGLAHYWEGEYLKALAFLNRITDDARYNKIAFFLIGCCNAALKRHLEAFLLLNRVYRAMGKEQWAEAAYYMYLNLSRKVRPARQDRLMVLNDPLEIVYR